ncbi:hypothetical protein Tco_0294517 [Tanacetum coccineum]
MLRRSCSTSQTREHNVSHDPQQGDDHAHYQQSTTMRQSRSLLTIHQCLETSSGLTNLVADETVHEEGGDSMERAATTAASFDAEQDSGSGPRRQDTILGDRPAQTRFVSLSKQSNDPPLLRVNTLGSGEDSIKLNELMEICTRLSKRVLALENIKTAQDLEITNLKKRVKKLEKKTKSRTPKLKRRLFKVRIESSAEKSLGAQKDASKKGRNEIQQDEGISCINITTAEPVTTASAPITTAGISRGAVSTRSSSLARVIKSFRLKKRKDIWENVKMILEGSELTKDDRESQLYDEFEHFHQIKGETIQGYYVRFTKLINDMRNIKMTMSRMQLNSKFMNNMLPEWSRFITEVKLNREPYHTGQLQSGLREVLTENLIESLSNSLAFLTQSYKSHLPQTNNQLRASSNARNQVYDSDGKSCCSRIVRGKYRPKRLQDSDYFKDKMLLMQAQESGAVLDEEQSLFLAGEQVTNVDDDVDDSQENDLALNVDHIFEADECDAFDSDVDEGPTSQTMFMANLTSEDPIYDEAGPSYDSNNPFEVQDHDAFVDHMDEYHDVHEMQNDVQHNYVVDSDADYTSDSNIIPYDQYVEDNEEHVVQCNASSVRNDALMSILDEIALNRLVHSRLTNISRHVNE